MIVDNSYEFRQALDEVLSDAYKIVQCCNGRDALKVALEEKPEIIVLDLMLTELDGISLLQEIRKAGIRPMVLAGPDQAAESPAYQANGPAGLYG